MFFDVVLEMTSALISKIPRRFNMVALDKGKTSEHEPVVEHSWLMSSPNDAPDPALAA